MAELLSGVSFRGAVTTGIGAALRFVFWSLPTVNSGCRSERQSSKSPPCLGAIKHYRRALLQCKVLFPESVIERETSEKCWKLILRSREVDRKFRSYSTGVAKPKLHPFILECSSPKIHNTDKHAHVLRNL